MIALLLHYWQAATLVAALSFGALEWHLHNQSEIEKGQAIERMRVADSTLKAIKPQMARVDTLIVRDTVRVRVAINHVVQMTDTVLHHLTDTVLVKEFVTKADSAAKACSELSNDCQAFRSYATQTINALNQKLTAQPKAVAKSCTVSNVIVGVLGLGVGYVAHR